MPENSGELDEVVAAASICPDCSTFAFAYRSMGVKRGESDRWEFLCPECGIDFTTLESELVFQSQPEEWLLAKVHAA